MKLRKTQVAAAVGAALFVAGTTVYAQTAPTVQVYGQVSRALLFADDGTQSKWFHVDNEASGTRFGITGTGQALPALRFGFRIEVDLQSNESQRVNFGSGANTPPTSNFPGHDEDAGGFAERHMDAWMEGAWGRLNIGQGDGAANGASESDLSGTGMANGIGVADIGGGIAHRTAGAVPGTGFGPTVGSTINQQDFESRYDRLMYVTPTFGGFRAQASWGQNGNGDIKELAAFYGAKLGGFGELAAALGWSEAAVPFSTTTGGQTKRETFGGSISWLHGSGINLTAAWTERDNNVAVGATTRDSTFTYLKLGFKRGAHAVAVDWAMGEDFVAVGDEATMYGIGYVWNPVRWLELYAAYKIHQLDRTAGSLEDVTIGTIGTRVRF